MGDVVDGGTVPQKDYRPDDMVIVPVQEHGKTILHIGTVADAGRVPILGDPTSLYPVYAVDVQMMAWVGLFKDTVMRTPKHPLQLKGVMQSEIHPYHDIRQLSANHMLLGGNNQKTYAPTGMRLSLTR